MLTKKELRNHFKIKRQETTEETRDLWSMNIANQVLKLPIWDATYFHVFLSIPRLLEIDTQYILHILSGKDKEIVVSKSDFETREMSHFLLTDNTRIKPNAFGIPEPMSGLEVPVANIEVVFVPLLAADKNGHRLGYGKGFYDVFLSKCSPKTVKIGLSFWQPVDEIPEISKTDVALDWLVTPDEVFEISKLNNE
jgi:5-formyltetrahydrofolate cyclo-ligase